MRPRSRPSLRLARRRATDEGASSGRNPAALRYNSNVTVPARQGPAIERAAALIRAGLPEGLADVTVADAAARTGLSLREAELGLHRLVARHRGHLAVTERGELLFRFPDGFAVDVERRSQAKAALRSVGRGLAIGGAWLARIALTVFLVGYAVAFATGVLLVSLAAAFFAEDSSPVELSGMMLYGLFELLFEGMYWTLHPVAAADPEARMLRDAGRKSHFHERVNRFFFGPGIAPVDPLAVTRILAQEIRARRGRVGLGDVVRVTGLRRDAAEAAISRMLVDYDGHVEVSDDGVIFYRFDELRITADARALPGASAGGSIAPRAICPPAIWHDKIELPAFTDNTSASNWKIVGLLAFVGGVGAGAVALGLPWYLAELPAYGAAALATIPLFRIPSHFARRRAAIREIGRRAVLARVYESATEAKGVTTGELREAWWYASDHVIAEPVLVQQLLELDGDLVIDDDGNTSWRFVELERQMRALAIARTAVDDANEQSPGAIVFRTDGDDASDDAAV